MNARLRLAIQAARAENMPKDNIERAIKKAAGGDAESYEAIRYEGYGPGGVAVIVEALTDNRNRTGGAIRAVFTKHGGNLGATGAVSHMFAHVGEIAYPAERRLAPTRCWRPPSRRAPTTCRPTPAATSSPAPSRTWRRSPPRCEAKLGEPPPPRRCGSRMQTTAVDEEKAASMLKLIAGLEDDDDVQNVYSNFEVSDAVLAKLTAA